MECNVTTNPNVSRNYRDEERTCYIAQLQLYSTYTMIPAIIYLVALCVAGVIGNSIVLFVYSQRFRSTASGTFIMAIAVFDLLANIILIPGDIHSIFHYWNFDMVYPCKLRRYGHAVTHGASSLFLVALAVTRYRKICKPFCNQVTVKQARIICIGLTLLAMAMPILYFIILGIQKKKIPNQDFFGYVCNVDDKFNGTALHKINTILMECNVSTNPNVSKNYTEEERTCYLAHLQLYSTYTMIPAIIFLGVLYIVGIIGNSIVLFVYSQRFRSTASGTFIMAIAVFDLMANLVLIPGDIHSMFHHWDFDMVYPCKLRLYGHAVTYAASSLFLVALAVTRSYLINTAVNPIVYSFCDVKFRMECLRHFKRINCH
ncbi:uncharacterized protein LOC131955214 [Physella acuta]|uniref:uncharacterized protein LOC131955214 n=1 Tax=Physella acuta TaxID=109671 RepID=UPI0027DCF4A3|nr:uncharacterized protein LOC131955214 [Physella acuta]